MIKLYSKDFITEYGTINTLIEAFVEEERNGLFELRLIMLNTDSLFKFIEKENIVAANANDSLLNQKFRIYNIRKLMNNRVEVYARHISFDLMYDYIDNLSFENQSCQYALNQLFMSSNFSKHYKGYSDIVNAQNYSMSNANILEAIGGKKGSIIDTFGTGAEILRDNENIHVLNRRGNDNLVTIEYRKNLTGFELEEDTTDLVTRILPYARYTLEGGEETVIKASYVDSPLMNNYSHPYIKAIDYTEKFKDKEVPTVEKLTQYANFEYSINKVDIPKQNYKIEFIPLSKCVGYEGLKDKISLCDTVTIIDPRYNVNTQAKVIKAIFNVLKNRYEAIELGEPKTSLGDIISSNSNDKVTEEEVRDIVNSVPSTNYPNTLPSVPTLEYFVYGFSNIELRWTFENKAYYSYEVYASKTKDFIPNTFDLIYQGKASSYMFQAQPNETWYFKVCAINSHNRRTSFSNQVEVITTKISDLSNYVGKMAIGDALIGELNLGRGWVGQLNANLLDVKGNFSVTDGNGKRTMDIDSFGNVNLDVASLKIKNEGVVTSSELTQTEEKIEYKFKNSGSPNIVRNYTFKGKNNHWGEWGTCTRQYLSRSDGTYYVLLDITGGNQGVYQNVTLEIGKQYTLSCICEHDEGVVSGMMINHGNSWITTYAQGTQGVKKRISSTFIAESENATIYIGRGGGEGAYGVSRIESIQLEEGDTPTTPRANNNELIDGITTIDGEGVGVKHELGSMSRFNSQELYQANENGDRTFSIRFGGARVYAFSGSTNYLGGLSSTRDYENNSRYRVGLFGTNHASSVFLGMANYSDDTQSQNLEMFVSCNNYDSSGLEYGVNIMKPLTLYNGDFNVNGRDLVNTNAIKYKYNGTIYTNSSHELVCGGAGGVKTGFVNTDNTVTIYSTLNMDAFHLWRNLDLKGYSLINAKSTLELSPQSLSARSKQEPINLQSSMSYAKDEIRYSGSVYTSNGYAMVEIPQVIAENIDTDYKITIGKYGFGDYYIGEKTPYYFEIHSEKDVKFDFEVIATKIDRFDSFSVRDEVHEANNYLITQEEEEKASDVNCIVEHSSTFGTMQDEEIEQIVTIEKLKKNNELYKLYTRQEEGV